MSQQRACMMVLQRKGLCSRAAGETCALFLAAETAAGCLSTSSSAAPADLQPRSRALPPLRCSAVRRCVIKPESSRPLSDPPGVDREIPVQCQGLRRDGHSYSWGGFGERMEVFPEGNRGWQGPNNWSFQLQEGQTKGLDIQFSLLDAIQ